MKAVKAIYENGKVKLCEKPNTAGPLEVLVVFPESSDEPWEEILSEKSPRPAFAKFAQECLEEIRKGKAKPLRFPSPPPKEKEETCGTRVGGGEEQG